jgi:hypothetical protein
MIAGPFESQTFAGRRFVVDGDDDAVLDMGGKNNEYKANGDNTGRVLQSRAMGTLEGSNLAFDPESGDVEYLVDLKNKGKPFDWSGTANDGTIYSGSVVITGELKFSYKNGTVPVTVSGHFEKQG